MYVKYSLKSLLYCSLHLSTKIKNAPDDSHLRAGGNDPIYYGLIDLTISPISPFV
jgi:hypothetical protein